MAYNMPPATPQRPTPGAFVATPAPGRPAFSQSASIQQQLPAQSPAAATAAESPVQRAAQTINKMIERDGTYPSLDTYVKQGFSGEYELPTNPAWTPFQKLRSYQLPDAVLNQADQTQMSMRIGLFAEINHAWVTVDNQLYLWDYTHPNPELVGFEEQPNNIRCVKLVKPRPKVFVSTIDYLLVVATTADIFLLAVECQRSHEGVHSVTLYRTGLSVSVRRIAVDTIEGSVADGRIFFGDSNSEDVWELNYQQEDRWFSSRCSKTNHVTKTVGLPTLGWYGNGKQAGIKQMVVDDTRKRLYTLSTNSTIKVFFMRTPATLECVLIRTLRDIKTSCSHVVRQSAALEKMEFASIDPIVNQEAEHLSLMVTTNTGCRLYLSTTSGGWLSNNETAPSSMQLHHIRFPPDDGRQPPPSQGTSTQLQQYQGSTVIGFDSNFLRETQQGVRYAPGSFFSFVLGSANEQNQTLFMSAPHSGLLSLREVDGIRFSETGQTLQLQGRIQEMGLVTEPFMAKDKPIGFGNELATQYDKPLCEFAIITSFGIETIRRRRLVDILAAIIKNGGGSEGIDGEIRKLAKQYGLPEMASTALAVACGQGSDVGPDSRVAKVTDPEVLEYARKAFIDYGGRAQLTVSAAVEGPSVDNVRASPRHDGIAMYMGRLVRSIWTSPVIKEGLSSTGAPALTSTHSVSKLQDIQRALIQLQEFLDVNKSFIEGLTGPEALGRVTSRQEEVELQGENRALTSLVQMINHMVEGIAFVLVLFEERLEDILALLPPSSQINVRKLTFEGLFSAKEGKSLAKELVKAIVNRNITKGSNVETVAEALRRKCGSFCSSDDVVIFKAQECLKKAADIGANSERGRILLNDSLRLFEQVAKSLTYENLAAAVDKYIELEFYAGAIRLALQAAHESDRGNKALAWVRDGMPDQDVRKELYETRKTCYKLVFKVIEAVDRAYNTQANPQDGVISQISRRKHEAYEQINNSVDEVFQNYLYDWYLENGWADRLLEISSEYVVEYLRRSLDSNMAHADLLWRYYAHYNDYLSAAGVQYELAKSNFNIPLERRIEYLSRAKANASTRMTGFSETGVRNRQSRQELLRNISDHLDIANIQDDVLQKIKSDERLQGHRREEVIQDLDGSIQSLDDLYHKYADQAGYYDICLLIYHSADYRNLPDIRSTWTNLIEQTHKEAVSHGHNAPWELVAVKAEDLGHRVNLNENVFPANIILQLLLQYDIQYYTHDMNGGPRENNAGQILLLNSNIRWPIDVFVHLNAPFEILVATLEALWYAQEAPFTGRSRKLLVKWVIYTVEQWSLVSRRSGQIFGGQENAIGLSDCLRVILGSGELGHGSQDEREWAEMGRSVMQIVDDAAR